MTVVGDPGIGKSRLAAEAMASAGRGLCGAAVCPTGRGSPTGRWSRSIKQLDVLPTDPAAAAALRSLLGESDAGTSAEEVGWAFRKLLEDQAPLVVVFDDLQWGEESFLDLIEHVALLSRGVPLLLLCLARPELLDGRPTWPVTIRLAPLDDADTESLIGTAVPDELRARIAAAAAGNPLFVGEMLAMTQATGADIEVPPTLKALLAARLDQLDPAERRVLECGSVEGEVFHRGAVQALTPEEAHVTPRLAALVRRELIRADRPQFAGEDGFRFRHLLIRDATYDALPKAVRTALHEQFAAWLEERGALVELDELLGYHLEQAARYKAELGQPDPALAGRAGERLAAAGHRALWRSDVRAAQLLLERALELTRPTRLDVVLELDLAQSVAGQGRFAPAAAIADAAAERARAADDTTGDLLARVVASRYLSAVTADTVDELEQLAEQALPLLEQSENHAGLASVWAAVCDVANNRGRFEDWAHAAEQALLETSLAGRGSVTLFSLGSALVYGPRPADEALRILDSHLSENAQPQPLVNRAWLLTMLARFEEAAEIADEADDHYRDLTGGETLNEVLGGIAATAGRHEDAAELLRDYCDQLEASGRIGYLSSSAPELGRSLCKLGRFDEAEPLAQRGRELASEDDLNAQMLWRQVQALVEANRGHHSHAEQLAREAVALGERSDALNWQGDALSDLAEVLHASGQHAEAGATLSQALQRYERKMNLAQAAQTRDRLAELQNEASR